MGSNKSLPGSRARPPEEMAAYIVALKETEPSPGVAGRRQLYESNAAQTAAFQEKLKAWLKEQGLDSQVASFGQPTAFPVVSVACTAAVADRIRSLPEVESVFRDTEDIAIVR